MRTALERLGAARTPDARALLAAFAWHHSHDAMEAAAWSALRSHGPDAADTLFLLFPVGPCSCARCARRRSPSRASTTGGSTPSWRGRSRATGPFPVDAANALDLLGDARAVPSFPRRADPAPGPGGYDNPLTASGFAAARARATLALGGFDTASHGRRAPAAHGRRRPGAGGAGGALPVDPRELDLLAIERAPAAQRRRAGWWPANYVERAGTPEATAAAARAREAERRASGTAATVTPR